MTTHHITGTDPAGLMTTLCGLTGHREIGGGMSIAGKWSNFTTSKTASPASCEACAAVLYKALPARLKPPTIYANLKAKLGREPSNRELIAECDEEKDRLARAANRRNYLAEKRRMRGAADRHAAMKKAAGIGDQVQNRPGPATHGPHKTRAWKIGRAKK